MDDLYDDVKYACPECGRASPVDHWNEETESDFGEGIEPLNERTRMEGFWYTCPECSKEVGGDKLIRVLKGHRIQWPVDGTDWQAWVKRRTLSSNFFKSMGVGPTDTIKIHVEAYQWLVEGFAVLAEAVVKYTDEDARDKAREFLERSYVEGVGV